MVEYGFGGSRVRDVCFYSEKGNQRMRRPLYWRILNTMLGNGSYILMRVGLLGYIKARKIMGRSPHLEPLTGR